MCGGMCGDGDEGRGCERGGGDGGEDGVEVSVEVGVEVRVEERQRGGCGGARAGRGKCGHW